MINNFSKWEIEIRSYKEVGFVLFFFKALCPFNGKVTDAALLRAVRKESVQLGTISYLPGFTYAMCAKLHTPKCTLHEEVNLKTLKKQRKGCSHWRATL